MSAEHAPSAGQRPRKPTFTKETLLAHVVGALYRQPNEDQYRQVLDLFPDDTRFLVEYQPTLQALLIRGKSDSLMTPTKTMGCYVTALRVTAHPEV